MLLELHLQNFRKHRDSLIQFSPGLSVVRAPNEGGKTSALEAVCYALFGVRALRSSLEDTVTHGEPVGSLKVTLSFSYEGRKYFVYRAKSGAEMVSDGVRVTGQTEVTANVCALLKVDAAAAAKLMLSGQSDVRGALESGTKATTELIERLAEFDQIDNLIELMQAKLTLGSPAVAEAALARAQETLVSAQELAKAPDLSALELAVASAAANEAVSNVNLQHAQTAETAAQESHAEARVKAEARASLERSLNRATDRVREFKSQIEELSAVAAPVNAEKRVAELRQRVDTAGQQKELFALYTQAQQFFEPIAGDSYEGTPEQLAGAMEVETDNLGVYSRESVRLEGVITLLKSQLTHGTCSFCGKDFSGVPEVAERNAETRGKLLLAETDRDIALDEARETQATVDALRAIYLASRPALKFLAANPDNVEQANEGMLPPVLRWKGAVPSAAGVDVSILRSEINELLALQKAYDNAQAKLETVRSMLETEQANEQYTRDQLSACPEVTVPQEELDAARAAVKRAAEAVKAAVEHHHQAKQALKDAKDGHSRALKSLEDAQEVVRQRSAEIDALVFNNKLLKRVREARPIIADRLWNLVLRAVSNYFSEIRGTKSRVTKDSEGFKVDDHPVATLSGSTLDALGLAIRVALVRTFLPSAPFLILDEPAAAMDEDRTHNMLGFLASVGFQQILLVTHEDVSESVADNMIQL